MKNLILALLTTLFVNAMPLQAAYAQADDAKGKEACAVSYKDVLEPGTLDKLKEQNGTIVELEGVRAKTFQSRVEEAIAQKALFTSDHIVIVNPNGEVDTIVNVAFFVNDCLKVVMHLPQPEVDILLSPLEKKPGERVD